MNFQTIFTHQTKFTKALLAAALLLIIYGYLCRLTGIYFFWESRSLGYILLLIAIASFLFTRIKIKNITKQNTLPEKVGIGLVAFVVAVQMVLMVVISLSDAYAVSKKYVAADKAITAETGEITGFGFIPVGGIQRSIDSNGEYGNASINLTIKGNKKYKDVTISVVKYTDRREWEVVKVE